MRTLKELIPLMIEALINRNAFSGQGLCIITKSLLRNGIITQEESIYIHNEFIPLAKPKWYMFRYYCKNGLFERRKCQNIAYYWNPSNKQVRIEWLEKQLSK